MGDEEGDGDGEGDRIYIIFYCDTDKILYGERGLVKN